MSETEFRSGKIDRQAQVQRWVQSAERIEGRRFASIESKAKNIAKSVWGKAWARHLSEHEVYAERLGRGRSHLRATRVVDFAVEPPALIGIVATDALYRCSVTFAQAEVAEQKLIAERCSEDISSTSDLLRGEFSDVVMRKICEPGLLLLKPSGLRAQCNCDDYADLCEHAAALLYAFAVHLDEKPEDLFVMRGLNVTELILLQFQKNPEESDRYKSKDAAANPKHAATRASTESRSEDLTSLFDIEFE